MLQKHIFVFDVYRFPYFSDQHDWIKIRWNTWECNYKRMYLCVKAIWHIIRNLIQRPRKFNLNLDSLSFKDFSRHDIRNNIGILTNDFNNGHLIIVWNYVKYLDYSGWIVGIDDFCQTGNLEFLKLLYQWLKMCLNGYWHFSGTK